MNDLNITISLLKRIKTKHHTTWQHRIEQKTTDKWTFQISANHRLAWAVAGPVSGRHKATWSYLTSVSNRHRTIWRYLPKNPVRQIMRSTWAISLNRSATNIAIDATLKRLDTGEFIDFYSISISGDEDSWLWSFSAEIEDVGIWQLLQVNNDQPMVLEASVNGHEFRFIAEGRSKSRRRGKTSYTITGRSPTVVLGDRYAEQLSRTWDATTAKTVAQELCSGKSIKLDWQTVDWPLASGKLAVKNKRPIEIIRVLANAVGAVIQSTPKGGLVVRPRHVVSPTRYGDVKPDQVITDADDILDISEGWEHRPGYNSVDITDKGTASEPKVRVSVESGSVPTAKLLKVSVVPWQMVRLSHTAEDKMDISYQGHEVEQKTEIVTISDGRGRLSAPWYGTDSFDWLYRNLGPVEVEESGSIASGVIGNSVLKIVYVTRYHRFIAVSEEKIEAAQVLVRAA